MGGLGAWRNALKKERAKRPNLLSAVRQAVREDRFFLMPHARQRLEERVVTFPELRYVLMHGWHEAGKDDWKPEYRAWNYAIRGATPEKRELRVAVSFDANDLLIVTVIDLQTQRTETD